MLLKLTLLLVLPALLAAADSKKIRILVLCTGNSARSQMTEGFLKTLDPRLEVYSAGTQPSARVNPLAVQAMQEIGIDISAGRPKSVQQFLGQPFDYVFTVCGDADRTCPNFSGKVGKRTHIGFIDPAKTNDMDVFRKVRDEIRQRFGDYFEKEIKRSL